jgi:hypothetical protein
LPKKRKQMSQLIDGSLLSYATFSEILFFIAASYLFFC